MRKKYITIEKIIQTIGIISFVAVAFILSKYYGLLRNDILYIYANGLSICPTDSLLFICSPMGRVLTILLLIFMLCLAANLIIFTVTCFHGKLRSKHSDDPLANLLLMYLNEKESKRTFLVSGPWGVGKTTRVNDVFNRYFSKSRRKVYRITCFGISNRSEIISEVNKEIERKDDSLRKSILELIRIIPVLGEFLYHVLGKEYSYKTIRRDSIFVFDDFERISGGLSDSKWLIPSRKYIGRSASTYDGGYIASGNIDNDIEKISKAVKSVYFDDIKQLLSNLDSVNRISDSIEIYNYDKYLAVAGLISELVDILGMKVVIICDETSISPAFSKRVLTDKLDCIRYQVSASALSRREYADRIAASFVFESDDEKQRKIKNYINANCPNFEFKWINNLRRYGDIVYDFVYLAEQFNIDNLTDELMNSLLISIALTYFSVGNRINLPIGINILYYSEIHQAQYGRMIEPNLIHARWVGSDLAYNRLGSDISGIITSSILDEWKEYPYQAAETAILSGQTDISHLQLRPEHITYLAYKHKDEAQINWNGYISNLIGDHNFIEGNEPNSLLGLFEIDVPISELNANYINALFSAIYERVQGRPPQIISNKLCIEYEKWTTLRDYGANCH